MIHVRPFLFVCALFTFFHVSSRAAASDPSKEACLESHSRGQDAKEQGKLSLARKLFMTCAQASCPGVVQSDCARMADELERYQPSLTFSARDSQGNDLPDTTVYIDDVLVVTHLDDGRPHDVDPGKHVIRFQNGGRDKVVTVVVGSGEKGRAVVGNFASASSPGGKGEGQARASGELPEPSRALGPRIMIGLSAGVMVGGAALGVVGLTQVPSKCSLSKHECAAPPTSAVFDQAKKAVRLSNVGWAMTGVGAVAMAASVVWYLKSEKPPENQITPFVTKDSAGIALAGRL